MTGSCTGSESQLLGCPPAPGWNAEAERRGFVLIGNLSSECRPGMDEVSLHCGEWVLKVVAVRGERGRRRNNFFEIRIDA